MADNVRIEELRRRVQKDPASIAFAQLAEEYRRAGRYEESIETCEAGLTRHPGYLSAHVTLGRSLIEVGHLDRALDELSQVLRAAPENLAALRGLAEIHHRQGSLAKALEYYRTALEFARHDPDLEQVVAEISRELEPRRPPAAVDDGLTFEQVRDELFSDSAVEAIRPAPSSAIRDDAVEPLVEPAVAAESPKSAGPAGGAELLVPIREEAERAGIPLEGVADPEAAVGAGPADRQPDAEAGMAQIAELERWLDALRPVLPPGSAGGGDPRS